MCGEGKCASHPLASSAVQPVTSCHISREHDWSQIPSASAGWSVTRQVAFKPVTDVVLLSLGGVTARVPRAPGPLWREWQRQRSGGTALPAPAGAAGRALPAAPRESLHLVPALSSQGPAGAAAPGHSLPPQHRQTVADVQNPEQPGLLLQIVGRRGQGPTSCLLSWGRLPQAAQKSIKSTDKFKEQQGLCFCF